MWQKHTLITFLICCYFCFTAKADLPESLFIKEIEVSGNKVTREYVILRELDLSVGNKINRSQLNYESRRNEEQLMRTNLFLHVNISHLIKDTTIIFYIHVKEKWYIVPEPVFELADRNFNAWWQTRQIYRTTYGLSTTHHNLTGHNDKLTVDLIAGWREKLGIKYRYPYLNEKKTIGLQALFLFQQGKEVGISTKNDKLHYLRVERKDILRNIIAGASLIYRPGHQFTNEFTLEHSITSVSDTVATVNPEYLGAGKRKLNLSSIGYVLSYDRRDRLFYPNKGFYGLFVIKPQVDIQQLGTNFLLTGLSTEYYLPLSKKLSYTAGLNIVKYWNKIVPYSLQTALGYRLQVRGYENYVINGNAFFLLNSEAKFKVLDRKINLPFLPFRQFDVIPLAIYTKLYVDQGYVNNRSSASDENLLVNSVMIGRGVGLDFITFYDKILRLEYSFNGLNENGLFIHLVEVF